MVLDIEWILLHNSLSLYLDQHLIMGVIFLPLSCIKLIQVLIQMTTCLYYFPLKETAFLSVCRIQSQFFKLMSINYFNSSTYIWFIVPNSTYHSQQSKTEKKWIANNFGTSMFYLVRDELRLWTIFTGCGWLSFSYYLNSVQWIREK